MTTKRPIRTEDAIAALEARGYVVLKAKSYRAAQERQRIAECRRESAEEYQQLTRLWAVNCLEEERRLMKRCEWLYGLAARHGATDEELRDPALSALLEDVQQ